MNHDNGNCVGSIECVRDMHNHGLATMDVTSMLSSLHTGLLINSTIAQQLMSGERVSILRSGKRQLDPGHVVTLIQSDDPLRLGPDTFRKALGQLHWAGMDTCPLCRGLGLSCSASSSSQHGQHVRYNWRFQPHSRVAFSEPLYVKTTGQKVCVSCIVIL